ncbi:MAG: hypothetical protein A3F91_09280 [Flavobacteria bacterium RIFCSPLOWO2_12_FULL_35_11]|nr:MAG: hypothetical protein A3F91_09280 [Flavobacteria bacterium RIFCSPLOWO2_12_FULL_35_11]
MKKNISYSIIISSVAALLLVGCAEKSKILPNIASLNEINNKTENISVSVVDMPVRKLIKTVCETNSLSCDLSIQPSDKYVATFTYNGLAEGILPIIKRQTGVEYSFLDGVLSIQNKDEITIYEDPLKKSSCSKDISISFKNMAVNDAFKYFYDEFGFSFNFDLRHSAVTKSPAAAPQAIESMPMNFKNGAEQLQKLPHGSITFYYNGCDPREALQSFLSSLDYMMVEARDKEFKIRDYDVAMIDKSVYYNYSLGAGSSGSGGSQTQPTASAPGAASAQPSTSGGTAANTSSTVSISENPRADTENVLRRYLSSNGKLDFSMRGYIVIEDSPSYVKRIKSIISKESAMEAPLNISVNIVRVDLNNNFKAGVDWNAVLGSVGGFKDISVSGSMAGLVNGGFALKGNFKGAEQVLTMLQDYGNTKIERSSSIRAKSGFLASYDAIKPVPYITTGSTITGGTTGFAQSSTTPIFEQEGVSLNILPSLNIEQNLVNLGIDVTVAEYTGDKSFDLGEQGIYTLPVISKDKGRFAVQAKLGETIVLTGFKVKRDKLGKKGVPFASQIPWAGALFGYQEDTDEYSEILIVLKVDRIKL